MKRLEHSQLAALKRCYKGKDNDSMKIMVGYVS